MKVLAIHAIGHDTGVALYENERLIYFMETERLTRRRYDHRVLLTVRHVLSVNGIGIDDIDLVALSTPINDNVISVRNKESVMCKLARKTLTHVMTTCDIMGATRPCMVVTHEASHAMLAVHYGGYCSPMLVLVNEGQGQFSQNALFLYDEGTLTWIDSDMLPWYGRGLGWTGIGVLFGMGNSPGVAGKLMAMSGYGSHQHDVEQRLREIEDRVTTDREYAWETARVLADENFLHKGEFQRKADIVATFQRMFTDSVVKLVSNRMKESQIARLGVSGGCGLNIVTNTALRDIGILPSIPPSCNDSGHALGLGSYVYAVAGAGQLEEFSVYSVGESESDQECSDALIAAGLSVESFDADVVARTLAEGGVVAFAQGRSECGPRALGNRSLLASPVVPGMKRRVSEKLKNREWYRPLATVVPWELGQSEFGMLTPSPYMLYNYDVRADIIPEATHVDGTCRLQTFEPQDNPRLGSVVMNFTQLTGTPGVINTSLNSGGRAISLKMDDVLTDFSGLDVDLFVMNDVMGKK